ncbi:MAG: FadR family transcriptional regulator [Firmicutes bacterium]|nr:FadR family transcriptional regulator [Candidatus Fermentithermobacillaceae bacterium]
MTLSIDCNDTHYTALKILSGSSTPIGAWNLSRQMVQEGTSVSEATAGRILRDLEDKGYVRAEGRVGRVITPLGDKALTEWLNAKAQSRTHTAFVESLRISERQELIDVLVARRAIETETAYLAAQNATDKDLRNIETIIKEHEQLLTLGSSGVEKDVEFHRALAEAGKNKVLLSALDVIYHDPEVGRALEYIRAKIGSRMVEDHKRIFARVLERDDEGARQAMAFHIDNVIKDVNTYWADMMGPRGGIENVSQRSDS